MANLSNINGKFVVEQTTGYVGVGTTDPNYPIEVLNASAEIALNSSGGSIYRLRSDSTDFFRINKNGVGDRLVIDGSGNVGIGTTSPSADLHVNSENTAGTVIISRTGTNIPASTSVGTITFPADYNSSATNYAQIRAYSNNLSAVRGSLDLNVKSTSGTLLTGLTLYGTNSGVNVGMGTTSPLVRLQLERTVSAATSRTAPVNLMYLTSEHPSVGYTGFGTAITHYSKTYQNSTKTEQSKIAFTQQGDSVSTAGSTIDFYTKTLSTGSAAPELRMRINYNGNVGIGVTDPDSKLEIKGAGGSTGLTFKTTDASSNETFFIQDGGRTGVRYWPFSIGIPSGTALATNAVFQVEEAGLFTVLSTGNVGIGTTNPNSYSNQNTLTINGPSTARIDFENSSNLRSSLFSTVSNTTLAVSSGFFTIDVGGSERMRITSGGDIQIPTNSASLQFQGAGSGSYTSIRRLSSNQLIVANTAGNQVFGIGNGGELAITNGASYSGTETYSNAWNAGYQTLILGSQLSPNSVYMITINVGGGFGTPPYYASAVFTIVTAPSTNSTGGGFDNIAPTATHVSSNAYWKYRLSCISTGRNGVEAWLVNGPTNPPVNPTIYVKATKIMTM